MTTTAPLPAPAALLPEGSGPARARAAVAGMVAAQAAEARAVAARLRWIVQLHGAVREARVAEAQAWFAALDERRAAHGVPVGAPPRSARPRSQELLEGLARHRLVLETAVEAGVALRLPTGTAVEAGVALRLPTGTAVEAVREALVLAEDLPAVLEALEQGTVTWPHARAVLQQWQQLVEEVPGDVVPEHPDVPPVAQALRLAQEMLDRAPHVTVAQLQAFARRRRARLVADVQERRRRAARKHRAVWTEPADDGLAWVHALLDAPVARAVADRIERLTDAVGRAGAGTVPDGLQVLPGTGPEERESRSPGEIRADVLADLLLDGELPEGSGVPRGIRGQVCVTVPVDVLVADTAAERGRTSADAPGPAGRRVGPQRPDSGCVDPRPSGGTAPCTGSCTGDVAAHGSPRIRAPGPPAQLEGYGPIGAEVARQLAAGAGSWHRLLTHPVTGVVLHHDRTVYAVPADLRRYLRLRDDTCRFPGCRRPASTADVDHTVAWEDGGRTDAGNLAHLCRHHHLVKHREGPLGRWSVRRLPLPGSGPDPGMLEWRSPSGVVRRTAPETAGPEASRWLVPEVPPSRAGDEAARGARLRRPLVERPDRADDPPPF